MSKRNPRESESSILLQVTVGKDVFKVKQWSDHNQVACFNQNSFALSKVKLEEIDFPLTKV